MKNAVLPFILFFSILSCAAFADNLNRIELNDGSVIIGELSGMENGIYTVKTQGMGPLLIEESRIKQIGSLENGGSPLLKQPQAVKQPQAGESVSNKAEAMRNKMLGDQEAMGMVMSLQNDPQFQEILQDPEIMSAIQSGNSASLANNEKFMRLKNNPKIQAIKEKIYQ